MPDYTYTARDAAGQVTSGMVSAENDQDLRHILRVNGLFLTTFNRRVDSVSKRQQSMFRPRKVKLTDMVVMSRQLATLVRAGLPIIDALNTVATQTENILLADALKDVRLRVMAGSGLAEAMRAHPKVFPELYCALVDAGEVGGVLDQTLELAAVQFDKEADLRDKVRGALVYPKLVVFAAIAVVAFMVIVIVPKFQDVYTMFHAKLPPITLMLVSISNAVIHYGWAMLGVIILIIIGYQRYRATPQGRINTDRMYLHMPATGKLMRKIAISRFTQTFGSATRGGIPILRALAVSANTAGNHVIRDAVMHVATKVQEGTPLAPPLDETGEFPPMVIRLIAAGEKSGSLPLMLEEISKFYERDIDYTVQKLTRMLEPIMTIGVGALVLFVLLSLYMPIFTLTQVIKK